MVIFQFTDSENKDLRYFGYSFYKRLYQIELIYETFKALLLETNEILRNSRENEKREHLHKKLKLQQLEEAKTVRLTKAI